MHHDDPEHGLTSISEVHSLNSAEGILDDDDDDKSNVSVQEFNGSSQPHQVISLLQPCSLSGYSRGRPSTSRKSSTRR